MNGNRIILAIGLALTVFATQSIAQAPQVVKYQEYPGSIIHIVNWAMVEKGFCERQKIKCVPVYLASGPLAQQAAAAGSVDIIYSSIDVMMQAAAKGNDLQVIGAQITNNIYSLAVGNHVPQANANAGYPANMRDLKGRKVGVSARGSATEMYTKSLLRGAGMEPDSVIFVAVGSPSTAFAALSAKQVDAVLSWDPVPALCAGTGVCRVAVDLRKGEGPSELQSMNGGFVAYQARREYVEKNSAAVDAFLRASAEATTWTKDPANFPEVMELARKNYKLGDMPNRDQIFEQIVKDAVAALGTGLDRKVINGFNDFLIQNKVLDKPLSPEAIVYKKAP
jgi:NitT/TauT family transport system substrate-binding protein